MLLAVIVYAVIGFRIAYVILVRDTRSSRAEMARVYQAAEGTEWEQLRRRVLMTALDVVAALCQGLVWPLHIAVLTWEKFSLPSEGRFIATKNYHSISWLVEPFVFFLIFASLILLRPRALPPDFATLALATALLLYATLFQIKLLLSLKAATNQLMRSRWDPRVVVPLIALIQVATLSIAYAGFDHDTQSMFEAVTNSGHKLVSPGSLLDIVREWPSGFTKEAMIAASGVLLAASILGLAKKCWTLLRSDQDIVDLATSELFMHRFKEAEGLLERVKVRTAESELRCALAFLGLGNVAKAVECATVGRSMERGHPVPTVEGGAFLLSLATEFRMSWVATERLLNFCVETPPSNYAVYDALCFLSDSEYADLVEEGLRARMNDGGEYRVAVSWFLSHREKFSQAYAIASDIDCRSVHSVTAAAITLYLIIQAGTLSPLDVTNTVSISFQPHEAFDYLSGLHLKALQTVCECWDSLDELRFYVLLTGELTSVGNLVQADKRFDAAALHARLEEMYRLKAPASASDAFALAKRAADAASH
ncbi:hypothetical protein [Paraburkholderia sp. J10-1]|uniref:hypothetical protein n=1 Tax=Paraburkholderia sp. J10-1 TaxID=2805430 RepID=UPI002AB78C54|nr:hypothetical protein [Paraburkholderia sp. J10-1]